MKEVQLNKQFRYFTVYTMDSKLTHLPPFIFLMFLTISLILTTIESTIAGRIDDVRDIFILTTYISVGIFATFLISPIIRCHVEVMKDELIFDGFQPFGLLLSGIKTKIKASEIIKCEYLHKNHYYEIYLKDKKCPYRLHMRWASKDAIERVREWFKENNISVNEIDIHK